MSRVLQPETISTKRLMLTPLDETVARAVLAGDFSALETADGWPHDDTPDALRMATAPGSRSLVWLVRSGGLVIGECGTVGGLSDGGDVEIGYGLAPERRGRGYGKEVVEALSGWLVAQPEVERVVAREVLCENVASRRALGERGLRPRTRRRRPDVARAAPALGERRLAGLRDLPELTLTAPNGRRALCAGTTGKID